GLTQLVCERWLECQARPDLTVASLGDPANRLLAERGCLGEMRHGGFQARRHNAETHVQPGLRRGRSRMTPALPERPQGGQGCTCQCSIRQTPVRLAQGPAVTELTRDGLTDTVAIEQQDHLRSLCRPWQDGMPGGHYISMQEK